MSVNTNDTGVNVHGRFLWYELMTTDVQGAKAFYTNVVGWGLQDASPDTRYVLFTAGDAPVSGLSALPPEAIQAGFRPGWLGYVGVDDVDASAERMQELGGAIHVPPKEIPNVSRFAIGIDPQMATIGLLKWLRPGDHPDAEAPGRTGWHELLAADSAKAWDFYRVLFGWRKDAADVSAAGEYQLFSIGGVTIGGMFSKPDAVPISFWLYYFNVGDIDVAAKRVSAGGGQILTGPLEVPGSRWILQCTDPQGAMFALVGKRSHAGVGYFERMPRSGKR